MRTSKVYPALLESGCKPGHKRVKLIDCETSTEGGRIVWRVSGSLDAYTSDEARTEMRKIRATEDLVVDVSGCTYIDSAGLLALMERAAEAESSGGSLVVRCESARLLRAFEQTGFDRLVVIEERTSRPGRTRYQTDSAESGRLRYRVDTGSATAG